jgi:hypothetical protein
MDYHSFPYTGAEGKVEKLWFSGASTAKAGCTVSLETRSRFRHNRF